MTSPNDIILEKLLREMEKLNTEISKSVDIFNNSAILRDITYIIENINNQTKEKEDLERTKTNSTSDLDEDVIERICLDKKVRKPQTWFCKICDKKYTQGAKLNHFTSKKHELNKLIKLGNGISI